MALNINTQTPRLNLDSTSQAPQLDPTAVTQTATPATATVPAAGFELGGTATVAATPELAQGQQLSAALAAGVAKLATLAGTPGAQQAMLGDIDFAVPESFGGFDPLHLSSTMAQLGTAFGNLSPADQDFAPTVLTSFFTTGHLAQEHLALSMFGRDRLELTAQLATTLGALNIGRAPGNTSELEKLAGSLRPGGYDGSGFDALPQDVNALVQWVLRESYLGQCKELEDYANKVKFYNDVKKQIREELAVKRQLVAQMAGMADDAAIPGGPQPTFDFNVPYGGAPIDEQSLTPEQQQALDAARAEQERQALLQQMATEYETARAGVTPRTVTVPDFPPAPGSTSSREGYAEGYAETLAAWYRGLGPEDKAAVREYLEANGLTFNVYAEEYDWHSGNESSNNSAGMRPLGEGEDIEAYFTALGSHLASRLPTTVDGSDAAKWSISLSTNPSGASVQIPGEDPAMPPELAAAGYVAGQGFPAQASGDGTFKRGDAVKTKAELQAYIDDLEEQLSSVGDDAQLANVDLQNCLQKQQQTMQMMSNISKMLNDTAMAVIRKIGG